MTKLNHHRYRSIGYGISIAYACLLDIIRSIALAINGSSEAVTGNQTYKPSESERKLHTQLINSSWCGLLAALSPLIDARLDLSIIILIVYCLLIRESNLFFVISTDESATENVLKAIQTFASLCGQLDLQTPRDAFITAICKASLPPHYALTVLYNAPQGIPSARQQESTQYNLTIGEPDYRQQVVAVGTPLPTASLPVGMSK